MVVSGQLHAPAAFPPVGKRVASTAGLDSMESIRICDPSMEPNPDSQAVQLIA
jgi:hypothetical protein